MRQRVDIADTDLGAVVYYGRYVHYLDRAVVEYRRYLGIPPLGPEGHLFVVRNLTVSYQSSARFDDLVEVFVRTSRIGRTSHTHEARIERVASTGAGTLLAEIELTVVGITSYEAGRPSRMPEPMRTALTDFEEMS
jgi:acyl-CoA thioester hydrolase